MSTELPWRTRTFQSGRLPEDENESVFDRQNRLPGFCTSKLQAAHLWLIGAGGLGSHIAGPLVRKGLGLLEIFDGDVVEVSNLNRQHFYFRDLFKPKAIRLARNAAREGHSGGIATGHFVAFSAEAIEHLFRLPDLAICAVDNNATRSFASRYFRQNNIPVVFTAVNERADYGWVFVQEPKDACLGCLFPRLVDAEAQRQRCQPIPAVVNILGVVGGIVLHAVDVLIMCQRRDWNFHSVHLSGNVPGVMDYVLSKTNCRLCQGESITSVSEDTWSEG